MLIAGGGGQRLSELRLERRAQPQILTLRPIATGYIVAHLAIEIVVVARNPQRHALAQRQIGRAIDGVTAVLEFVTAARLETESVAGLAGDDADSAEARVLAEQGRLRPLDKFHAVDVEERGRIEPPLSEEHAIGEQRDRLFERLRASGRAHAAESQRQPVVWRAREHHAGNERDCLKQILDALCRQGIAADGLNADRHTLHGFGSLLRGNDDFADAACIFLGLRYRVLGLSSCCTKCAQRGRRIQSESKHEPSPLHARQSIVWRLSVAPIVRSESRLTSIRR